MRILALPVFLALSACQSPSAVSNVPAGPAISALQAVMAAADAAPRGVPGTFSLVVKRAEMVGPRLFLNSEQDYRDQRNLSIAIQPQALALLRDRLGKDLAAALRGRTIRVGGVARRTRIAIFNNGKPTNLYYYQTHVSVGSAAQIEIVG